MTQAAKQPNPARAHLNGRISAEISMASMYLDSMSTAQEKALSVAIALRNALGESDEDKRCDPDFWLASVLVDLLGSATNEIAARKHLNAALRGAGQEVTS